MIFSSVLAATPVNLFLIRDGNVHVIPKTNLKITPIIEFLNNHKTISGFIVITDNGFKYEFGIIILML